MVTAAFCLSACGHRPIEISLEEVKEDQFLDRWVCLEGVAVSEDREQMKVAFDKEAVTFDQLWDSLAQGSLKIEKRQYDWKLIESDNEPIIFLGKLGDEENVYTYALAEVESKEDEELLFGLGSDDAVKVWVNNELVHEKWVFRGLEEDDDIVSIKLNKGANRIVVKVLNGVRGWGFALRPVSLDLASSRLAASSSSMSLETLDLLLERGAEIDRPNKLGLTAYQQARLNGLEVRAQQLLERGADASIPIPPADRLISTLFEQGVREGSSGLAYLVSKNGEIIDKGAYGFADIENQRPLTIESKFRIGSISKQFTAVGILRLQEQGSLSIEDPLSRYLPDFPKGDSVTLRQLLNHTSGIHSYTSQQDFNEEVVKPIEQMALIEKIKGFEYDFEPGESWLYNNSGYFILGYVIEQVSGESLSAFWEKEFFGPLGMVDTGVYVNGDAYENEALGYSRIEGVTKRAKDWDMTRAGGAGNLYSTVDDLYKWNEALFNGKILDEESFKEATTPAKLSNGEIANAFGASYGLGLMIRESDGHQEVLHGGGLDGFFTMLIRDVDEALTYVMLSNSAPSDLQMGGDPFRMVASVVHGLEVMETEAIEETEFDESWNDYVGEYDYIRAINTVSIEDGRMYAQLTGQPRLEIFKRSGDSFYWKAVAAEFAFERDESGKIVGGTHTQNGRSFKVKKMEPLVRADIDPDEFVALLGYYKLNEAMIVSITLEDDKLFAQATGQRRFEIVPLSKYEYRAKGINIRIVFSATENETVDSLTLYQAGAVMNAPKI